MTSQSRRSFLSHVGRGMLISSVGSAVAFDLGLADASLLNVDDRLTFGAQERLVSLMQETPLDQFLTTLIGELRTGASLQDLISAGSLANARAFGGNDYVGYHSLMALAPALQMSGELPAAMRPLPVLKVLYRNTQQIHAADKSHHDTLVIVPPAQIPTGVSEADWLLQEIRSADYARAESAFAALQSRSPETLFQHAVMTTHENPDVHRVVLAWRSWAMLDITGQEHATSLLRQSIRYAVHGEQYRRDRSQPEPEIRALLPQLLDRFHLAGASPGNRDADDTWLDELAGTILASSPSAAAEAAAQALADGFSPEAVGEAMSLAANLLLLQDPGRTDYTTELKPRGSVHGDSVGVHASDAANAWRNIVRASPAANQMASLLVGAYHTAGQRGRVGDQPWPTPEHLDEVRGSSAPALLQELHDAVQSGNQALACAVVARYAETTEDARPVFERLVRYATSEDGALHAEKFYRTVSEEFLSTRPSRRWRHVIGLARVTASEYGRRADGYDEACELLGIS